MNMATKTNEAESNKMFYAIVGNIPPSYHSADLRRFFYNFIEDDGFDCFHFKHRPEGQKPNHNGDDDDSNVAGENRSSYESNKYTQKQKSRVTIDPKQKLCCVVRLSESKYQELVQLYHRKHWIDRKGHSMPLLCFISKIKVKSPNTDGAVKNNQENQADEEKTNCTEEGERNHRELTENDINQLQELHPPYIMPHGNVGTPSKVFLKLIEQCRLPPKVITNLGLTFPKSRRKAIYSNVALDYGDTSKVSGRNKNKDKLEDEVIRDCNLGSLPEQTNVRYQGSPEADGTTKDSPYINRGEDDQSETGQQLSDSDEDADECEEWERHEALHDDPANIERNKERKYEEELEVVWEKGGPGLVWYTDEQYWREQDGDFDEQTTDDWDVDMSVYYEPYGGDKDARDMVTMRRDMRRRQGFSDKDDKDAANFGKIGEFEKYTKGIGRKVLEKQGWTEGSGLGSTITGIACALDNEGQKPTDKTGFGYRGEKLQRWTSTSRTKRLRRDPDDVIISTVYDKPEDMEIPETLLRRSDPKTMTYRKHRSEWKPSHSYI